MVFTPDTCLVKMRSGFTLLELLVVIGVIMVLFMIVLPMLQRARSRGEDISCVANLRGVHVALESYAIENGGKWPAARGNGQSRFIPASYEVRNGSQAQQEWALDPYLQTPEAAMCPTVVGHRMMENVEQLYWYGSSVYPAPERGQQEGNGMWDPYPSLAWCMWPNLGRINSRNDGKLHGNSASMHVLRWDGSVSLVPSSQWRRSSFP